MATTATDIANKVNCAVSSRKGTGNKHCVYKEGVPSKPILSKRGFDYNTITDLTLPLLAVEVQKKNIFPLPNGFNFARLTEDNVLETSQIGKSSLSRKGIYKYRFTWDRDDRLQSVMSTYDSNDRYDYVACDSSGNMKLVSNSTKITGATCGLIDTDPFTEADGSVSSKVGMMIELNNPRDYNDNATYFAAENLPFDILKLEGINDVTLTPTAFASGATVFSFSARLKDGTTPLSGADKDDFQLIINGTPTDIDGSTITISESGSTGDYTISGLTAHSADDVISISTYDASTQTVAIIQNSTDVYEGVAVEAIVL